MLFTILWWSLLWLRAGLAVTSSNRKALQPSDNYDEWDDLIVILAWPFLLAFALYLLIAVHVAHWWWERSFKRAHS